MDVPRAPSTYERFQQARARHDVDEMVAIALALAQQQQFNVQPGSLPALLHDVLGLTEPPVRTRIGCALARAWSYAGAHDRAGPFAGAALAEARALGDPDLEAEALDAELLAHWGPDDVEARTSIARQLAALAAYLSPPRRMNAHLWRLTTALEAVDAVTTERELRALEALAEETGEPRIRFYADSRLAMRELMVGRVDVAEQLRLNCGLWAAQCGEPDAPAIDHALAAGAARVRQDRAALAREAADFEDYGLAQGVKAVLAEGAGLWLAAGEPERALRLAEVVVGDGFHTLARDVDWLGTMAWLAEVACGTGRLDWVGTARDLLAPFAGRAVVDAGAVGFHGVVDDYLARSARALGEDQADALVARAASLYRRLGAHVWEERLDAPPPSATGGSPDPPGYWLAPSGDGGSWKVGPVGAPVVVRHLVGLGYLHRLLLQPDVEISALRLAAPDAPGAGPHQDQVDQRALAAYRTRLGEIDGLLDDADRAGDAEAGVALTRERDALLGQVRNALGLAGRSRAFSDDAERARVAVRRAIRTAYDRLAEVDAQLARLLRREVTTGYQCAYRPVVGVRWRLSQDS